MQRQFLTFVIFIITQQLKKKKNFPIYLPKNQPCVSLARITSLTHAEANYYRHSQYNVLLALETVTVKSRGSGVDPQVEEAWRAGGLFQQGKKKNAIKAAGQATNGVCCVPDTGFSIIQIKSRIEAIKCIIQTVTIRKQLHH